MKLASKATLKNLLFLKTREAFESFNWRNDMIRPVFLEDFFLLSVIHRKPNGINLLRNAYYLITIT